MSVLWHSMPRSRPRSAAVALLCSLALGATACGGPGGSSAAGHRATARPSTTGTTTGTTTTTTTGPPASEEAVRRAYLQSWDDYARAVWNLDPSGLDRTYASDGLADIEVEIQQLSSARHRVLVNVTHDLTVVIIDDERASVTDRTVEASVAYDADTRVPVEAPTPHARLFQMILQKIDGHWKVVFTA
jgi:hypothetical protein